MPLEKDCRFVNRFRLHTTSLIISSAISIFVHVFIFVHVLWTLQTLMNKIVVSKLLFKKTSLFTVCEQGSFFERVIIKNSNNIAVDPAVPVILSKAKYLCSAWLWDPSHTFRMTNSRIMSTLGQLLYYYLNKYPLLSIDEQERIFIMFT